MDNNRIAGMAESDIAADYERRRLGQLSDQQLVASVADIVGVPRAEVVGNRFSFVLHAPLELMARAALLPYVAPEQRERARLRIAAIAAMYQASGPPVAPPKAADYDSLAGAAGVLADAIDAGDLDTIDSAAAWLGHRARPDQIVGLLSGAAVDRLSAAGHGNIYFALLSRTQPRGLPMHMLRHPARALGLGSEHRIHVPPAGTADATRLLLNRLAEVDVIGPPPSFFIAPMVEHAQDGGAFAGLLEPDGTFVAPAKTPFELQRFAAQAMLQGPPDQAPYGWTHCLTLAQAPLLLAAAQPGRDPAAAIYVATAYLAAHWAGLGDGHVDLTYEPADPGPDAVTRLATAASVNHDAHRVKYTLACLDAVATDPSHRSLYLAAASYLNGWWDARPDAADPLGAVTPGLVASG